MPAPLTEPMEKVTWRVSPDTLSLLRTLFPGRVNEVVRVVLDTYVERLTKGLKSELDQGLSAGPDSAP